MFQSLLAEMQAAARVKRIYLSEHARDELDDDGFVFQDVIQCLLTGEIVEEQYDLKRAENKYVVYGDTVAGAEMAVVVKLTDCRNVFVITGYRLRITDYE
ncbi:MAG: DUF4258 domain-containing protein [Acidobacteria bacterium]|nr:DUF4258 domain-containing protein [Acidobacteriota bacterium]MBI3425602.1 DUF4258 domain-containing protein [Acidobacteriota bacterium]